MKFNVTVEIDWINEDYSVDEKISDEIRRQLVNKIYSTIQDTVSKKITNQIDKTLDKKIMETYDNFLDQEVTLYDDYGEPIKELSSIKTMLKEKLDKFMSEKVDKSGKATSYSGESRYFYLLNKQAQGQVDDFINKRSRAVIDNIKEDLKQYANSEAIKKITKAIFSDYKIKELLT